MTKMANTDYLYSREFGYDLFRRLFIEEPTQELLLFLQGQDIVTLFDELQDNADFLSAAKTLNDYLASHCFDGDGSDFDDLHWDFTRLFIGPEQLPAPPWESVYLSKDKLLFQQCTNEVKRIYHQNGFFLPENETEAADHIGFELDFLYHQSALTVALFEQPNADRELAAAMALQIDFLQRHPLAFCPSFSANVQQYAETEFYRSFAAILPLFLSTDKRRLERSVTVLNILLQDE
jgi:TorA maturation chaperone TorD